MPTDKLAPAVRVLFAAATVIAPEPARELARLLAALPSVGIAPLLLHRWGGAGRLHVDRREAADYPIYRSDAPELDSATLALLESPAAVVLLGRPALSLAPRLVAANIPLLLWAAGDAPLELGGLAQSPLVALAAARRSEAERLARLQGASVATLPVPPPERNHYTGGGEAILVLSPQRGDGAAWALALAEALPAYSFLFPMPETAGAWYDDRLGRLTNVQGFPADAPPPPARLALLPHCAEGPPWEALAAVLRAGIPLVVGDAPLLAGAVGPAGRAVPLAAPIEIWLAALTELMADGAARTQAEAACAAQADALSPPAPAVARAWRTILDAHIARCKLLTVGRV